LHGAGGIDYQDVTYKVKPGVELAKLEARPEMLEAVERTAEVYRKHGAELTITSGSDGQHLAGAKHSKIDPHYTGEAFDCRILTIPSKDWPELANDLRRELGADFVVVLERDHIHIQKRKFGELLAA
jgi:hypothetical protein